MFNRHLRKWLGVPKSFSSIGLYSTSSKLQLPLSSITEEFKVTKTRQVMMLRDSKDDKVKEANVDVRTGRKWVQPLWQSADARHRRELVKQEVRRGEEDRQVRAVSMKQQGQYMKWEMARPRKISWHEMWRMDGQKISFLLRSVYDVLPTPTNLTMWKLIEDPSCKFCGKPANLEHVLSSCRTALKDGRYTWRHDQVLREIAAVLDTHRRKKTKIEKGPKFINFIKGGGESSRNTYSKASGIIATANDWEMQADVGGKTTFPREILITTLRPDIVLWSRISRQVILVELTVPWETRLEEAHERKLAKYQELVTDIQEKNWRTWYFPVEVGCRGFVSQTFWRALGSLGLTGPVRRSLVGKVGRQAEEASGWVWRKREEQWKS
ncbi:unnamed protein product [Mytilus coruscus]|uniref:Reverse transcriptase zinc-binding domain-containing protein n=1 Tax=Mytilus coruscus TaxID=42192 RepID=A0A6J8ECZ3_MYTCO|nr:unnamed protein product [Mytilus coruscus]